MMEALAARIAHLIERRPGVCVAVGVVLLGLSVWAASSLRINQDFMALLPPSAPEVQRLEQLNDRLGNQSDLIISIESPSRDANIEFGEKLASVLRARDDMRWVLFRRDKDFFEKHALFYMGLDELLELRDDVVDRIKTSVEENVTESFDEDDRKPGAKGDQDAGDNGSAEEDPLSEESVSSRYDIDERMPEFMETDEGRLMVIKARPRRSPSDLDYAVEVNKAVKSAAASLNPSSFHPEMAIKVEGSFAEQTRRGREMRSAVVDGSVAAFVILLFSIGFFFRSGRAVGWVLAPLLVSVTAALGFASVYYGHLNLVSAFIFAVLLGLGIDFGVHVLARYRDERGRGASLGHAWRDALSTTGVSTAAGALSTAGAFLVLSLSRFQGFAQFGVVAAVGVGLALLAAVVLMPALVVLTAGKSSHTFGYRPKPTTPLGPRTRFPVGSALILSVALAIGVYGAVGVPNIEFEYDLSKLGPERKKNLPLAAATGSEAPASEAETTERTTKDAPSKTKSGDGDSQEAESASKPPADGERWRDAAGRGTDTAPAIVLTQDLKETEDIHRQLAALLDSRERLERQEGPPKDGAGADESTDNERTTEEDEDDDEDWDDDEEDPFANMEAPEITLVRELAARENTAEPRIAELLNRYGDDRRADMSDRIQKVFSIYDFVPNWQPEKLVLIRDMRRRIDAKRDALTPEDRESVDKWYDKLEVDAPFGADQLPEFVKDQLRDDDGNLGTFVLFWTRGPKANYKNAKRIRDAFWDLEVENGTVPTAADYYALPAIIDAIADDGPMVIIGSVVVMLIAAWLLMGGLVGPIVVFGTVGIALLWLAGLMHFFEWKTNLFNLIALPLLVGMGQDDALHLFHRYKEDKDLRIAVRETGSAIFLTSWTTAIGFAGIFFANHRGLLSLARVAVIGVALCWLSSVVVLPAAIRIMEWLRDRKTAPSS